MFFFYVVFFFSCIWKFFLIIVEEIKEEDEFYDAYDEEGKVIFILEKLVDDVFSDILIKEVDFILSL